MPEVERFEETCTTLLKIFSETDYYLRTLSPFSEHIPYAARACEKFADLRPHWEAVTSLPDFKSNLEYQERRQQLFIQLLKISFLRKTFYRFTPFSAEILSIKLSDILDFFIDSGVDMNILVPTHHIAGYDFPGAFVTALFLILTETPDHLEPSYLNKLLYLGANFTIRDRLNHSLLDQLRPLVNPEQIKNIERLARGKALPINAAAAHFVPTISAPIHTAKSEKTKGCAIL